MAHYLLSVVTPTEGEPPTEDEMNAIMGNVATLQDDMQSAGVWVFSGGLEAPDTATVLRRSGDDVLVTDGPFVELKEAVNGYLIFEADDLDAAIELAAKVPAAAMGGAVEVRPIVEY